ncbi:hypothetical protein NEOLI_003833 [Neolecta irregularis DAH-3]|uniref:DUF1996 domain-containing protein n=1 Tax=Neolecta irregularis (strain DAH-3) TaxID=1198029 RepID=A0A1U7LP15_NEOID|nr:hypothetical protein NEOLI_003833 [Neolecta irregularis DAH-3]|eukprot:OLL24406.1 hypothetical protein NEOLI_003833 [Neolecta irregularis DAH-3]
MNSTFLLVFVLISAVPGYFVLDCTVLTTERLDPIRYPGQADVSHMHTVLGGSHFEKTFSYENAISSSCTTCNTQADKSNYWQPSLYHKGTDGKLSLYPSGNHRAYYKYPDGGRNVMPVPNGLQMIVGSPDRQTQSNSPEDKAVYFVCVDGSGNSGPEYGFPKRACSMFMQASVSFPQCWDGVNLNSADHRSHVSYSTDGYDGQICPSSHPVRIPQVMIEMIWQTNQFDYHGEGTYVLSSGDTIGYGLHGDFTAGWDDGANAPLAQAIKQCGSDPVNWGNIAGCPPLLAYQNQDLQKKCTVESLGVFGRRTKL